MKLLRAEFPFHEWHPLHMSLVSCLVIEMMPPWSLFLFGVYKKCAQKKMMRFSAYSCKNKHGYAHLCYCENCLLSVTYSNSIFFTKITKLKLHAFLSLWKHYCDRIPKWMITGINNFCYKELHHCTFCLSMI